MSDTDAVAVFDAIQEYHQRTKHHFERYAAGPETLDWDAQPAPFRHFLGAQTQLLPRLPRQLGDNLALAKALQRPFHDLTHQDPLPVNRANLAALLQLALGVTAWKAYGPDRWAVRANPSSGNLHPTEAYVLVQGVPDLANGLYHYDPEQHGLECRAVHLQNPSGEPRLAVLLTSVVWREVWKYGERAFRYCQLDAGHAIAAVRYAAAALGWVVVEQSELGTATLARVTGVDRLADFPARRSPDTEYEEAEVLLSVGAKTPVFWSSEELKQLAEQAQWVGVASTVDAHPMYRWPVIRQIAEASRRQDRPVDSEPSVWTDGVAPWSVKTLEPPLSVAEVINQRRSAQRFDADYCLSSDDFRMLLTQMHPRQSCPWDVFRHPPRIATVLFVQRVEGLEAGVYLMPPSGLELQTELHQLLSRQHPLEDVPQYAPLLRLTPSDPQALKRLSRSLHCHQDIAGSACLALGFLAPMTRALAQEGPSAYRSLYREAGLMGQLLYLEAEAMRLRGTGIGCFFDEPVHTLVGIADSGWQSLYHFTLGRPILDARIESAPAYPDE